MLAQAPKECGGEEDGILTFIGGNHRHTVKTPAHYAQLGQREPRSHETIHRICSLAVTPRNPSKCYLEDYHFGSQRLGVLLAFSPLS